MFALNFDVFKTFFDYQVGERVFVDNLNVASLTVASGGFNLRPNEFLEPVLGIKFIFKLLADLRRVLRQANNFLNDVHVNELFGIRAHRKAKNVAHNVTPSRVVESLFELFGQERIFIGRGWRALLINDVELLEVFSLEVLDVTGVTVDFGNTTRTSSFLLTVFFDVRVVLPIKHSRTDGMPVIHHGSRQRAAFGVVLLAAICHVSDSVS